MLRVGLTGGIGCGKTTVAAMMRQLGCTLLEADPIAHQLIEPGQPAYDEIVRDFGQQVLAPDKRIDRAKLAAVVFGDPARLALLNQIVHPRVLDALDRKLADLEKTHPRAIAVVEAALLIEAHYHERLDRLVVVWCEPEQQLARLLERGMTREDAQRRIAAQMAMDQKRRMADDEIDCSGSLAQTREQVEALVEKFRRMAAAAVAR
jgi:dephospho-CoA kinase